MDTPILTEALRSLSAEDFTWKCALYNLSKSRDGMDMEWNLLKMQGIKGEVVKLQDHLLRKVVSDKPVAPYSPFLSDKENIGVLDQADDLIHEQITDALLNIQNGQAYTPEDYVFGVMPKTAGYAFYGERKDENDQTVEQVLFMRRGNPFLSGGTARLYTSFSDEIIACEKPILKFSTAVDFLLIGGACYLFSSSIEKDFSLVNRHAAKAQRCMDAIADAGIVSDCDRLVEAVLKSKNARKFADFDKGILEHIARLPIPEREEFLSTYGVTIDPNGRMDSFDAEQCDLIIDLLCCRSCLDPLGRLSVGSNITPRE